MKKLVGIAALALIMSCDSGPRVAGPRPLSNADAAASALSANAETFYGPERFTRTRGAPDVYERTISTSGFDAPYVLHVRNGTADGQNRVSSARIVLDGQQLLGTDAFSQAVAGYDLPVSLGASGALHVEVAGAPGAYLDISVEGIPSGNLRVCPGVTAARTYETLEQALAVAQDGNTIWFCDGTHAVHGVTLGDKSLTLIAEHPLQATIDGLDGGQTITIGSATATTAAIEIRGLVFTNAHNFNVAVQQNYGTVRVTGSEFHPRLAKGDPFDAAGMRVLGVTGNGITIENDAFIGGDAGVMAGGGAGVRVLNSKFVEQWDVAIQGGNGEGIYAEANDIKGCGPNWCIAVFGGSGAVKLLRNTITIDAARPVVNVIQVHDGEYEISQNTITGIGGKRIKDDPTSWPIQSNAITVSTTGPATTTAVVADNIVKGAFNGLGFNSTSSGTVTDNVVSDVGSPINFYQSTVAAHRNDFSNYVTPFQFVSESPASSATCNWWGSAYGPDAPPFIDATLYTPWSAQPIAGTTVACDPTPGLPQVVRVCSVTDGSQTLHAMTIARAVALVATGGKIEVCDGTHVAQVVWLGRDVTIEAEHPLAAVLDGAGQAILNTVFDASPNVTLRGLVFTGSGTSNAVNAQNFHGALTVDGSEFRLVASYPYQVSRDGYQDHYTNGGIGVFDSPGSVTVRNTSFKGGDIGIHANHAQLLVQDSHFTGQSNAGTFSGFESTVRVENSTYADCGRMGCAKMFSATGGRGEFVGNSFTVNADHPVWTPIVIGLTTGSALLEDNVITGVGGDGDRSLESTYPVDGFAMQLSLGSVVLNRNHITNAYRAINLTPAAGVGTDNVVSHVFAFLFGGGLPNGASARLTRNDITDYVVGVFNTGIFSSLDLRCNWWGSAAGPANIGGGVLQASYTPWADQEIAGHPELPCAESYTVAFSDGLVDGNSMPRRLLVQQTDGSNSQVIAEFASDELGLTPAWSRDGSQIVFQVGVPQWGDLYLVDARPGATPVDITPPLGDGVDVGADFAPDGRILYTSTRTGNYELWFRNTDGTQTQITHTPEGEGGSAAFSPDGSKIAFARNTAAGGYEIWVMNAQPSADGTYAQHQVTNVGGTCGFPRWTPDGRLLFSGGGGGNLSLYFVDANASMATLDQVTAISTGGIEASQSDISSDGRKIIFSAFRTGALYVMNADGSGLMKVPLPDGVTGNYPRFKPVPR